MNVAELDAPRAVAASPFDTPMNVPVYPPTAWLTEIPEWYDPDGPLIQLAMSGPEEGRVAALVAPYDECILDGKEGCWTAPPSPTGYHYAHVGATQCAEGNTLPTANIGGRVNHADIMWPMQAAVDHYANTATRTMRGRYIDTPHGIMFLGSMWPGSTIADGVNVAASALSGDWRYVRNLSGYDMAGSQLVNNPAFRPARRRSAEFAVTASLGNAAIGTWTVPVAPLVAEPPSAWEVGEMVATKIASLTSLLVPIAAVPDVKLHNRHMPAPQAVEAPDSEDDDEWDDDLFHETFACPHCDGEGCRKCRHTGVTPSDPDGEWGYDMPDITPDDAEDDQ